MRLALACLAVLLGIAAGPAQAEPSKHPDLPSSTTGMGLDREVWIAVRPDGHSGRGTADDPFDGSSADKFDGILARMAPFTTIHLLPGTFPTNGYAEKTDGTRPKNITLKSGMKLIGAGEGVTVIQLVSVPAKESRSATYMVLTDGGANSTTGITVRDLTIDCNAVARPPSHPESAVMAITLHGDDHTLERVEVIHSYGSAAESWVLYFSQKIRGGAYGGDGHNCWMKDCYVHDPASSGQASAFAIFPIHPWTMHGGGIVNCRADMLDPKGTKGSGLNVTAAEGHLFSGNHLTHCAGAFYIDSGSLQNCVISNNIFECDSGICIAYFFDDPNNPQPYLASNVTIIGNAIHITSDSPSAMVFELTAADPAGRNAVANILISGNTVDTEKGNDCIFLNVGAGRVTDCLVTGNVSAAARIQSTAGATVKIQNNLLRDN